MEIARCAAQVEKLPEAIAQLERALQLDSGQNAIGPGAGEQRERIDHLLHRLRLAPTSTSSRRAPRIVRP